jgi:ubiquinone/menaquinone biosynthesis C-methylase UbiE
MTQKCLTADMRVVEFGCGTGSTAVLHAAVVKTYHAIDVSKNMIEIARANATEAGLSNMDFTVGTLEEANAPDGSCDAILGLNILHVVPDLDETLATVARMLVPGGYFFSSSVCLKDLKGKLRMLAGAARVLPFLPTVGSLSLGDLEERVKSAGFAIEERFEQTAGVVFLVARRQ